VVAGPYDNGHGPDTRTRNLISSIVTDSCIASRSLRLKKKEKLNGTQIGVSVLILLSLLSALSPISITPNQLTTVTYFTTATTIYAGYSYSISTQQQKSIFYSGSLQIPQLSPPSPCGEGSISVYSVGPFYASPGDDVSVTGSTDYDLGLAIWPSPLFAPLIGILQGAASSPAAAEAACATFSLVEDQAIADRWVVLHFATAGSPFDFDWISPVGETYYLVLETDGRNNANVMLHASLTEFTHLLYTVSYTSSTTVTSIQGYWVGQAMIYPIVKNAVLIAGLSALIALCVVAVVLARRRMGKH
jgi:hypothetical protein